MISDVDEFIIPAKSQVEFQVRDNCTTDDYFIIKARQETSGFYEIKNYNNVINFATEQPLDKFGWSCANSTDTRLVLNFCRNYQQDKDTYLCPEL